MSAATTTAQPIEITGHPRRWLILGILCLCLVLVVASISSLNVAIPSIQRALDASQSQLQWIVDAYALVFAGLLLPMGALGDRYGRKWTLLSGLSLYAGAAVLASRSTSPEQVIAGRAVMGIAAALIMPSTLSLLTSVFPPHERPRPSRCGLRSPARAAPSVSCRAACCCVGSGGGRSSSSPCPSS